MEDKRDYRVYFRDGNVKILEGENMYTVLSYLFFECKYAGKDVVKIEEVSYFKEMKEF